MELFLVIVGAWTVSGWCVDLAHGLARIADEWSQDRAHNAIGQAILDHEWQRTGNPIRAFEFARFVMTGQRVNFMEVSA